MKQIIFILSLCALCVLLLGCKKDWGDPTTKNYSISGNYTALDVSDAFEVTVSDKVSDVVVTVGEAAHKRVVVEVKNGQLIIGFKPNTVYSGTATAVIPASVLREIDLSGASSFIGDLSGDDVEIDLSGASKYEGNISANKLEIDLSGASVVTIDGACQTTMEIELSGGSRSNAAYFDAPIVRGSMSGGSHADVTCCNSIEVDLSGGSTLTYGTIAEECNPAVNCSTSGGSTVISRY